MGSSWAETMDRCLAGDLASMKDHDWAETMDRCSAGNLASMKDHDWAETMDRCSAGYLASMMESSWAETMDHCSAGDLALMMESSWAGWRRWSERVCGSKQAEVSSITTRRFDRERRAWAVGGVSHGRILRESSEI